LTASIFRMKQPFSRGKHSSLTGGEVAGETRLLPTSTSGPHAAVAGLRLLTRDARRYRTYFPTVKVIAPA